ncbi:hypothetical protein [Rhodococcus jostii]
MDRRDDRVEEPGLDEVYPVVFSDAIRVNTRDRQVTNRPITSRSV